MRLIMVVNVDWFLLSHRLPIALAARDAGYEVHLVTSITSAATFEKLKSYGFDVHDLRMSRSGMGLLGLLKVFFRLLTLFWTMRPDVVHLVTIKPVLLGGVAARLSPVGGVLYAVSGLGHVFIDTGNFGLLRKKIVIYWYRFIVGAKNMRIIFQNPEDRYKIESNTRLSADHIVMIPGSGVNLSEYNYVAPSDAGMVVMMAARLLETKGVNEFVEAARVVKKCHPYVRFLLIGAPDPGNPLSVEETMLSGWMKEGVVEVLGHRADIANLMRQSHIVVLPSYYGEGLPKVLIEAAACGRAVITTDMAGCRDAIEPGVTGVLVQPKDTQSLVDALFYLIEDRVRCIEMGRAGRVRAEKIFDVKAVVKEHIGIYENLMSRV